MGNKTEIRFGDDPSFGAYRPRQNDEPYNPDDPNIAVMPDGKINLPVRTYGRHAGEKSEIVFPATQEVPKHSYKRPPKGKPLFTETNYDGLLPETRSLLKTQGETVFSETCPEK